eukprot:48492-Eustigmatos_ZCMA.PRE.1
MMMITVTKIVIMVIGWDVVRGVHDVLVMKMRRMRVMRIVRIGLVIVLLIVMRRRRMMMASVHYY